MVSGHFRGVGLAECVAQMGAKRARVRPHRDEIQQALIGETLGYDMGVQRNQRIPIPVYIEQADRFVM
jgi:hypothetical protein